MNPEASAPARGAAARPARWLLYLGLPIAVLGSVAFAIAGGVKPSLSFLGGLALAFAAVGTGAVLVEIADRIAPGMAMIAALSNYLLTVLFFLILLTAISPSAVDIPAFASGLAASVVPYLSWQIARAHPGQ